MELVETQEVKKVKYKLFGGTPFARMDIDEVTAHISAPNMPVAMYLVLQTCPQASASPSKTHCDNYMTSVVVIVRQDRVSPRKFTELVVSPIQFAVFSAGTSSHREVTLRTPAT